MTSPFRQDFPFFDLHTFIDPPMGGHDSFNDQSSQNTACIYLDSAATSQKLRSSIALQQNFQAHENASVHRSAYPLANQATGKFETARASIAGLINANPNELVLTSGATESINLIAQGIDQAFLHLLKGPEHIAKQNKSNESAPRKILICESEHHANILPWQALAKRLNMEIEVLRLETEGTDCQQTSLFTKDTLNRWLSQINKDTAIVAIAHVSNVLGLIYPIERICQQAKAVGALSVIDGTQALTHMPVDVKALNCDFYVFSAHKMYGPNGVGAFYGRSELLASLNPSKLGGEMVKQVSFKDFHAAPAPLKFEAGTQNVAGVLAFAESCQYLQENMQAIREHEKSLFAYLKRKLKSFKRIKILGEPEIGLVSFILLPEHSSQQSSQQSLQAETKCLIQDNYSLASALYEHNIALRFGQHCAMPLLASMGIDACLRVSLACYNSMEDIDTFITALNKVLAIPEKGADVSLTEQGKARHGKNSHSKDIAQNEFHLDWEQAFLEAKDWASKHRLLLLFSKNLNELPEGARRTENEVSGCEAKVWLTKSLDSDELQAYASTKVVRGILAVLLNKHAQLMFHRVSSDHNDDNTFRPDTFDYEGYLRQLGLSAYFSQGRKDGVTQLIAKIRSLSESQ
uniref:aminotransferase class V-fold PLP-dependent enzyme n=1 Tax=Ningiella ruwaisensis TaxID=2364274 RepID=UPI00109F6377|nr:aminotransferase class V-fold PLP-dependent enzyme [Ningiella ruwaisensis]